MEVKKLITLSSEELGEAIQEYLAQRNIAFNIESIHMVNLSENEEEIEIGVEVISE